MYVYYMGVKTIYLSDEICLKLKSVENVSGLISSLLSDYFNVHENSIENLEMIKKRIEKEKEETIKTKEKEMEILDKQIKKETENKEQETSKIDKLEGYKLRLRNEMLLNNPGMSETEMEHQIDKCIQKRQDLGIDL